MLQLIFYRAIQGIGSGAIIAISFITVGRMFMGRQRSHWQGMMTSAYGLASVTGPIYGGYMVQTFSWPWLFWIFVPFIVTISIVLYFYMPNEKGRAGDIDYLGSMFLIGGSLSVLLYLGWAGKQWGWHSWGSLGLLFIAIIQIGSFIKVEQRATHPILPLFFS